MNDDSQNPQTKLTEGEALLEDAPLAERLLFLLDQLTLTSEIYLETIAPVMEALKTARSPHSLALAEKLDLPKDYVQILEEILQELNEAIIQAPQALGPLADKQTLGMLGQEARFWQEFVAIATAFTKKLILISPQTESSTLSIQPLQDTWQELRRLAQEV